MNKLNATKRAQIVAALVEGNSINATVRMTGAAKHTVLKLLADLGKACAAYQDRVFRNLPCKRIQCDEIWSFCYAKQKNVPEEFQGQFGFGDVWTWTALCADTKLVPCWLVGERSAQYAAKFIDDLASRLAHRVQLTTDGHRPYLEAVWDAFGGNIDYAMLEKIYRNPPTGAQTRYSPGVCCGAKKKKITGNPERVQVSTSYVERQNLTMRMSMRRFTRLTNAFSKKVQNLEYAVAIHFMNYNFARIHKTLRVTPAMEAGIADHVWSLEEIVRLLN
ncbi:MAG: IS1 family transposase [Nitrospira sp.]|nr:IS1 family transposase [Nitrospira sp.]MCA9465070.1 IS1 family transposase [Nitrospira sp.]